MRIYVFEKLLRSKCSKSILKIYMYFVYRGSGINDCSILQKSVSTYNFVSKLKLLILTRKLDNRLILVMSLVAAKSYRFLSLLEPS